jgi:hypothetical protein
MITAAQRATDQSTLASNHGALDRLAETAAAAPATQSRDTNRAAVAPFILSLAFWPRLNL